MFKLLLSIEQTPISIATSRKLTLLVSRIRTCLAAPGTPEVYVLPALYGSIGLLYNQFMDLSNSTVECLSAMIITYPGLLWDRFIEIFERCQTSFLKAHGLDNSNVESFSETTGMCWIILQLCVCRQNSLLLKLNPIIICRVICVTGQKVVSVNCL